jgi:hypothetical protein
MHQRAIRFIEFVELDFMSCGFRAAAPHPRKPVALFVAALACYVPSIVAYSEHLFLHELNEGTVAVTAAYAASQLLGKHDPTFPRSISLLLDSFPVQELNLTLTRGRWREEWCASSIRQHSFP